MRNIRDLVSREGECPFLTRYKGATEDGWRGSFQVGYDQQIRRGQRVSLIQVEIQHRGNDPKEYYDLFAEQVAPQFEFAPCGRSPVGPLSRRTLYAGLCPFRKWIFDPLRFGAGQSDYLDSTSLRIVFRSERKSGAPRLVGRRGGSLAPGLEFQDGALSVRTELAPLGETTIKTNGRGDMVTGSVRIVSDGPVGGVLRFDVPNVGVSGVGIRRPVDDALFPVRRREGIVRTAAAMHNLSTKKIELTCQLMKKDIILKKFRGLGGSQRTGGPVHRRNVHRDRYVGLCGFGTVYGSLEGAVHRSGGGNGCQ